MNTAQLKLISWGAALLFGAGLAAYVGNYLMHKQELEKIVAPPEIREALSKVPNVEKKAEDIVAYDKVNEALYRLNWTAKPPPKPPPPVFHEAEPDIGPAKVATLIKVLMVKADTTDVAGSRAVIKYLAPARVKLTEQAVVKHVGDALDAPCDGIMVAAIDRDGVWFKFADSNRAKELVVPNEFERRLDMEALANNSGGSSIVRQPEIHFQQGPGYGKPPEHTVRLDDNNYDIGTTDVDDWNDNYEQYLAEVEYDKHRDPATGKYDGIKLSSVPANSVAAQYGAKEGDVIKSINGHPVNTVQEALSWAKQNKDKYDVWEVEIESKGKTKIITYKVPKKK